MMIWVHREMHLLSAGLLFSLRWSYQLLSWNEMKKEKEKNKKHLHLNRQRKGGKPLFGQLDTSYTTYSELYDICCWSGPPTVITARSREGKITLTYNLCFACVCKQIYERTNKQNETIHCQIEDKDCSNLSLVENSLMQGMKVKDNKNNNNWSGC